MFWSTAASADRQNTWPFALTSALGSGEINPLGPDEGARPETPWCHPAPAPTKPRRGGFVGVVERGRRTLESIPVSNLFRAQIHRKRCDGSSRGPSGEHALGPFNVLVCVERHESRASTRGRAWGRIPKLGGVGVANSCSFPCSRDPNGYANSLSARYALATRLRAASRAHALGRHPSSGCSQAAFLRLAVPLAFLISCLGA